MQRMVLAMKSRRVRIDSAHLVFGCGFCIVRVKPSVIEAFERCRGARVVAFNGQSFGQVERLPPHLAGSRIAEGCNRHAMDARLTVQV